MLSKGRPFISRGDVSLADSKVFDFGWGVTSSQTNSEQLGPAGKCNNFTTKSDLD